MIEFREIKYYEMEDFFKEHIKYLKEDENIKDKEDIEYFTSDEEYRNIIVSHMKRNIDTHHALWFYHNAIKVGACHYCTYKSEDGKCMILDFWLFTQFRNKGLGHKIYLELENYTKNDGAIYHVLNSEKENSVRFWKSLGFKYYKKDSYGMDLYIKK